MSNWGNGRRNLGVERNRKVGGKDGDEDLVLFRDMHKRDSLLQPVPDELESNSGNFPFYRMSSGKKGFGIEFLTASDKHDYNWLKTPPATPLFPSLEMDAGAPDIAIQKELPILQPLSRFSGNSDTHKMMPIGRSKSPSPKPKVPSRSVTPSSRPRIDTSNPKRNTLVLNQKNLMQSMNSDSGKITPQTISSVATKEESDFSKPKKKPPSRGVSPLVRSTITGFSDKTPPNLRTTDTRPLSATRGRPTNSSLPSSTSSNNKSKQESINPRRQSCSPSMSRGRMEETHAGGSDFTHTEKMRSQAGNGNRSLAFGSSMVEKVINARKLGGSEENSVHKPRVGSSTVNNNSGFGRMMSKTSLDMALKHMEVRQDTSKLRRSNPVKSSKTTSNNLKRESSLQTTQLHGSRTQDSRKRN